MPSNKKQKPASRPPKKGAGTSKAKPPVASRRKRTTGSITTPPMQNEPLPNQGGIVGALNNHFTTEEVDEYLAFKNKLPVHPASQSIFDYFSWKSGQGVDSRMEWEGAPKDLPPHSKRIAVKNHFTMEESEEYLAFKKDHPQHPASQSIFIYFAGKETYGEDFKNEDKWGKLPSNRESNTQPEPAEPSYPESKTNTDHQFDAALEKCMQVFSKKLVDYGPSFRILRPPAAFDQLENKLRRIRSIQERGKQLVADSVEEDWIGVVNYAVIAMIQINLPSNLEGNDDIGTLGDIYDRIAAECKDLMQRKNHDYGEAWRGMSQEGLVDFPLVKMHRIKRLTASGLTGKTIALDAELKDIFNYGMFQLILVQEKQATPYTAGT